MPGIPTNLPLLGDLAPSKLPTSQGIDFHTRRLEKIIETLGDGITLSDDTGYFEIFTPQLEHLLGYTRDDANSNQDFLRTLYPDPKEHAQALAGIRSVQETGQPYHTETTIRAKDGTRRALSIVTSRIQLHDRSWLLTVYHDITDRRQMEDSLRRSEEKFRKFFADMIEYAYIISPEGIILDVNKSALEALGYPREELVNQPLATIYAPEVLPKMHHLFALWKRTGQLHNEEMVILTKHGQRRTVLLNVNAVYDENDEILHSTSVQTDITERKQMEEQLKTALSQKNTFLKEVYHRVKNNFNVISGLLQLQANSVKDAGTRTVLTESIARVQSMTFIHEHLYRADNLKEINFGECLYSIATELFRMYYAEGMGIELVVEADPVHLIAEQAIPSALIVNELVSNALKYAFRNRHSGMIRLGLTECNQNITLLVSDNGVGLPDTIDVHNAASLGLELTVGFIRQLRGTFTLLREGGTTFTVNFPRRL